MNGARHEPDRAIPGPLIGMVHVGALPGTPRAAQPVRALAAQAASEAMALTDAGFDAVLVENMHDAPYLRREVGPEIVSSMTAVAVAVKDAIGALPLGVQVLAGANRAALAVAQASGASFVRAEGFVFASVADEGLLEEADAGPLLRYRRAIGAGGVVVLADVKKKHSAHALTGDVGLADTVRAAAFFGADGVVVTGSETGEPVRTEEVDAASEASDLPVVVGSGATEETVGALLERADGVIVGSWIKQDGDWRNPVDPARARRFVRAAGQSP